VGAFVVYDMTEPTRFEVVSLWKDDVDCKVLLPNGQCVPAVLLVNKVGLVNTSIYQSCISTKTDHTSVIQPNHRVGRLYM